MTSQYGRNPKTSRRRPRRADRRVRGSSASRLLVPGPGASDERGRGRGEPGAAAVGVAGAAIEGRPRRDRLGRPCGSERYAGRGCALGRGWSGRRGGRRVGRAGHHRRRPAIAGPRRNRTATRSPGVNAIRSAACRRPPRTGPKAGDRAGRRGPQVDGIGRAAGRSKAARIEARAIGRRAPTGTRQTARRRRAGRRPRRRARGRGNAGPSPVRSTRAGPGRPRRSSTSAAIVRAPRRMPSERRKPVARTTPLR